MILLQINLYFLIILYINLILDFFFIVNFHKTLLVDFGYFIKQNFLFIILLIFKQVSELELLISKQMIDLELILIIFFHQKNLIHLIDSMYKNVKEIFVVFSNYLMDLITVNLFFSEHLILLELILEISFRQFPINIVVILVILVIAFSINQNFKNRFLCLFIILCDFKIIRNLIFDLLLDFKDFDFNHLVLNQMIYIHHYHHFH